MREETRPVEGLSVVAETLERATGVPMHEMLDVMNWVRRYVEKCVVERCEVELQIALERSGLGEMGESLIASMRR